MKKTKSLIEARILKPLINVYYIYIKKSLKFIPIISLIITLLLLLLTGFTFLIKISNILYTFIIDIISIFDELFNFSDKLQLTMNIFIAITILTSYHWLKRIKLIKRNPKLIKITISIIIFLIFTEHINPKSSIGQFVDWAIVLAVAYLMLAGLFILILGIRSIDLSQYKLKSDNESNFSSYFSDSIIDDPDPKKDVLKRWPFAQRVAETIALRRDPTSIVIGIYGAWGEGKSTVLKFIELELKKKADVICVRFNPWRFDDEKHLLRDFFQTLADALGRSISSPNQEIGKWLMDYAAALSFTIGGIVQLSPGEVGKSSSSIELDELRNRIELILKNEMKNVVILIDDIDRLDRKEIQAIFRLVKLSADFSYTTYVLAFDEKMVSKSIGENYSSGDERAGKGFIDKIVQVPLNLPKADILSLRRICFGCVSEVLNNSKIYLTEEQNQDFFGNNFINCLEIKLQNPRVAKKYGNALFFSLPLLKGEVNPVDLMLIEGMRIFYPKLYETIHNYRGLFLGLYVDTTETKERVDEIIEKGLEGLDGVEKQSAKKLLKVLFPQYDNVNAYYGAELEERLAKEQRIASRQYFNRYFSYTVLEGDISDLEIDDFIRRANSETIPNITSEIHRLIKDRNADLFVLKLKRKAENLPIEISCNIALSITKVGDDFPKPDDVLYHTTAFSQAGILVSQLVKNIPKEKGRFDIAKRVIEEGSVSFAAECFTWMYTAKERKEQDRFFMVEEENELGTIITERIKQFLQGVPIYIKSPGNAPRLLNIWLTYGSREETNQYLAKTLEQDPRNALELLKCYLPIWVGASGSHKGNFEQTQYDSITKVIDADLIYSALNKIYGSDLESPKNRATINFSPNDETIANQFAHIYRTVKTKEQDVTIMNEEPNKLEKKEKS